MNRLLSSAAVVLALFMLGLLLALSASSPPASAGTLGSPGQPQWGTDIKLNASPSVTPGAYKNVSLASNRAVPNQVLAGFTTADVAGGTSGYGSSTDGGHSWSVGRFPGPWMGTEPMNPLGDVRVAFDSAGVGYLSSFAIGNNTNGYFVLTTTNGTSWSDAYPVSVSDYSEYRSASALTVDPRLSGTNARSLYMSWIRTANIEPFVRGVWIIFSRDGGRTWGNEVQVSDPGHEFSYGPSIAVAADGTVYVAWVQVDNYYIHNPPKIFLDRSTDGGVTWGVDKLVTGSAITAIGRPDYKDRELTLIGGISCNLMRINHYPLLALSPTDPNTAYITWNDGRWEPDSDMCGVQGKHSDIAFAATTDGGNTWLPPVRVNNDPMGTPFDHFQPAIAVKSDGLIGLTWYDRRYSQNLYSYDVAYAQSTDGGVSWSNNIRVSDQSSDPDLLPDYKGIDDLGFRRAMAFGADYALPAWVDTRDGFRSGDIFVDKGVFPSLTATVTSTPSFTPTGTFTPSPSATLPILTHTPTDTPTSTPTGTRSHTVTPPPVTGTPTITITPTLTSTPTGTGTALSSPTSTPTLCPVNFSDVQQTDWFYEYVRCLYCRGAISGYADGTFRPYNDTTRGQLCKIVVVGFDLPVNTAGGPHFSDVDTANPFYSYIETAYNGGIISGYSDGTFRWGNNVTRGQLSKIVVSASGWTPIDPPTATFSDVPVGSAFYTYVETAYCHAVISGYADSTFRPGNTATRAQISKIVCLAVRNGTLCNSLR